MIASLRFRLAILFLILVIASLTFILATFSAQRAATALNTQQDALRYAHIVAQHHSQHIERTRQLLVALAAMPMIRTGDNPTCSDYLRDLQASYPEYTHIGSYAPDGTLICASEMAPPGVVIHATPFMSRIFIERDLIIGGYSVGAITQQQIVGVAYPIFEGEAIIGAVGVAIALDAISGWLQEVTLPPQAALVMTDNNGRVISTSDSTLATVGNFLNNTPRDCFLPTTPPCSDGTVETRSGDGITRFYGYTTLDDYPGDVYVSVGLSRAVVMEDLERTHGLYALAVGVFGVMILSVTALSGEALIVRPTRQLVHVTERLLRGDYSARAGLPTSIAELDRLAHAIDALARNLEARNLDVEQRTAELEERINQQKRSKAQLRETVQMLTQEQQARHAAQQAEQLKRRFLAMVSHELRHPLTIIKGSVTSLLADDVTWDPAEQQAFLASVDHHADHLLDMVEQLLDLSLIEAGRLRIHPEPSRIGDVVEHLRPRLLSLTQGHTLIIDTPTSETLVPLDTERISQVVINLVSNAAKYTPPGGTVCVRVSEGASSVRVAVSDTGPGVPEMLRPHLFSPFNRLEKRDSKAKGIGMGLAICKGVVEAHGGSISVEDHDGPGVTFAFTLPYDPPPLSTPAQATEGDDAPPTGD